MTAFATNETVTLQIAQDSIVNVNGTTTLKITRNGNVYTSYSTGNQNIMAFAGDVVVIYGIREGEYSASPNVTSGDGAIATINAQIAVLNAQVALLSSGGREAPTFNVLSVSSPIAAEGANLVFNIALAGVTQQAQTFQVSFGGTATESLDYASPFIFSNGVSLVGTTLNIPIGVISFTATTLTALDSLVEAAETVIFTVGGVSGIGTITNVALALVQSITAVNIAEGGLLVFTVTLDRPAVAGQVFTPTLTGGV